ncbi:MAG: pantoate--beta-alanine ligase [Methylacidiphilales bacterium]|nr:pantoate--beta-alanine ligase [Candidatus Methylacidiphilales bacterium]MDW8349055.1 pantoate--beta-alanine ligase [Verrucomicrobiae bacterium]
MKIIRHPPTMQRTALQWRKEGKQIALVPTMGALHPGHEALIKKARKQADILIVSIYVNPTQFSAGEDLHRYPRPFRTDCQKCRLWDVDIVFAPKNLYAPDHSTWVEELSLSQGRCGPFRPGHFRGVTTVVAKLFLICQPHLAFFGQKDAQQLEVIQRMVRDLHFPIKIIPVETIRDTDGLAFSSRNTYLSPTERQKARQFAAALQQAIHHPNPISWFKKEISRLKGVRLDYAEIVNNRLCAAVHIGKTRLIDNVATTLKKK